MKRLFIILIIGLVLVACNSTPDSSTNLQSDLPDELDMAKSVRYSYTIIEQGTNSGYTQFGGITINEVTLLKITSQADLNAFWSLHKSGYSPQPAAPQINFANQMLLVLICPVYSPEAIVLA